jgi:hypothetical protein
MLNRNGLSSCRFGCRLGCHLGSRFGCTLEGFGTRFGSFGGSPCGKQFASGTSRVTYNFPLAKTFAKPHTPPVAFAHTISVGRTVTVFFTTTWETTIERCLR